MRTIPSLIVAGFATMTIAIGITCHAEDNYTPITDSNFTEYTEATIETNRFMWITSKWKRSNNLNNWNEPTYSGNGTGALKINSTFLVKDGVIYLDGAYSNGICSFQRYNAENGEQLSPIEIPIPDSDSNLSQGFISLREDNAGNTYITGACTEELTQIDLFLVDLAECSTKKRYTIDASEINDGYHFTGLFYPIVIGDIASEDFSIWSVYKNLHQWEYNSSTRTFNQHTYTLTHAQTGALIDSGIGFEGYAIFHIINENEFILDISNLKQEVPIYCKKSSDNSFVYHHLSSPDKDNCPLPKDYSVNRNSGVYLFEHSGVKMAVYDPYFKKNNQTYFKILHVTEPDIADWTPENTPVLWEIADFATPNDNAHRFTLAQAIDNGANTDLYLYVSGLGLAAYNIIGPGSTTETEPVPTSATYSIVNNTILTTTLCDINVYTIQGQLLLTKCNTNNASLQNLPNGIYIVKMSNTPEPIKVVVR